MFKERRKENKPTLGRIAKFPEDTWEQCGEQFRGLRTRINFSFKNENHKLILVTSAIAEEGKTTVAVNLARSFAMASRRVLLIDCDMRRSKIHKLFSVRNESGLTDMLRSKNPPVEETVQTNITGLELLLSGKRTPDPTELLLSDQAGALFEKAHFFYDYVILDAPPVLPVADAAILCKWADGVLLVTECGGTPREVVKEAKEQLQGASFLGIVLNKIQATKQYYDYYGYY